MVIPHTTPGVWSATLAAGKLGGLIRRDDPKGCSVAILGLPDDLGVKLNAGRPGAAAGPAAIREALSRYGVAHPSGWAWPAIFDAGDIVPSPGDNAAALEATHTRVSQAVHSILDKGIFPIGLGGGHDLTYPFARGAIEHHRQHGRDVRGCVYFDAHLDVRDTPGSGMSFRRLVEDCGISRLYAHGINELVNSREHVTWFHQHGGVTRDDPAATIEGRWRPDCPYVASFDMDVIDASHVCGVSAMNPAGWTVREAAHWVDRVARDPACVCFDLMELSPPHDQTGHSARVAAHLLLTFLQGFSQRGQA
ncbi:MAG: arginase family protein [Phycisphaerales bacterium]